MNGRRLSVLLGLGAALLLALALLVPFAGAAARQATPGMMGTPTPWPTSTMMPTPMPSPSGTMMPTPTPSPTSGSGGWCGGGIWNGSGSTWGGTGMWGTGFGARWVRNHPDAFDAWLKLRADNMTELRAWFDQYRGNLGSTAAKQALQTLWQDHWNDMKTFYQQYADGTTWTCPSLTMWGGTMGGGMMGGNWTMWGTGYGTGWLMKHPAGFAAWQTLRARQLRQVRGWWTTYRSAPFGTAAQSAMSSMRLHHRARDLTYMRNHHITGGTAWSYRGWMGMGGTWGGFGW